jgi:hypothetical protein
MMLAVIVFSAYPMLAQSAQTPSKAVDVDPEVADGPPPAVPARPTITNPAHIPLPGYLQLEQGFLQANPSIKGNRSQFSIIQTTKLALSHHLMVSSAYQPLAHTLLDASDTPSGQTTGQNDTGDLQLGGQFLFTDVEEGYGLAPTLAIAYQHVAHAGTAPDIDTGGNQQGVTLLVSGTMAGLHYDTNYDFNEQTGDVPAGAGTRSVRRAQFGQSLSVTRQITEKFGVTAELWHFTQPFIAETVEGNAVARANAVGLLIAPAYNIRDNLVLDCGFSRGLTSTSTHWQSFAGFTYLLPKRLWPAKKSPR